MSASLRSDNRAQVKANIDHAIKNALEACGALVEGYAKQKCPVDTGHLRNSITHQVDGDKSVTIGTDVEYAPFVELGTSRMGAQPYLRPAVTQHMDDIRKLFESQLR